MQQANSDGNQSQSSGLTNRKRTDISNPDCTFSNPNWAQDTVLEDQSLVSRDSYSQQQDPVVAAQIIQNQYRQYGEEGTRAENHPFAKLAAAQESNENEIQLGLRNRKDTQEAHFGGSGSEKNLTDEDDEDGVAYDTYAISDDDDESLQAKLNESVNFLNEFDKKKHSIQRMPSYDEAMAQALQQQP